MWPWSKAHAAEPVDAAPAPAPSPLPRDPQLDQAGWPWMRTSTGRTTISADFTAKRVVMRFESARGMSWAELTPGQARAMADDLAAAARAIDAQTPEAGQ